MDVFIVGKSKCKGKKKKRHCTTLFYTAFTLTAKTTPSTSSGYVTLMLDWLNGRFRGMVL